MHEALPLWEPLKVKCWICNENEATSGEHAIKRSDINAVLGKPTQQSPLRLHNGKRINVPVGSLNADRLKLPGRICEYCNTTRSQPYDRSWEKLSAELRKRADSLQHGISVRVDPIFEGNGQQELLNTHLFFVKLFGCHVAGNQISIPLEPFSSALMQGEAHLRVFLRFGFFQGRDRVEMSNMELLSFADGSPAFASWFYRVGPICVNVMYAAPGEQHAGMINSWHPSNRTSKLIMVDFDQT